MEGRNQKLSRNVQTSVQRWELLVEQLHQLKEERPEVEARLQQLPEESRQKEHKRGLLLLLVLFKKMSKNFRKSWKKESEDGP